MLGLHYSWYLGMVFAYLPFWKGLLFVVLSQVPSFPRSTSRPLMGLYVSQLLDVPPCSTGKGLYATHMRVGRNLYVLAASTPANIDSA